MTSEITTDEILFRYYPVSFARKSGIRESIQLLTTEELPTYANKELVNQCRKIYKAYLETNDYSIKKIYDTNKNRLTCINVHNRANTLIDKNWITTNFLCYDYDKLTEAQLKNTINLIEKKCNFYMISPSGYGIKIFFRFDSITEFNFKQLYQQFGDKLNQKLNLEFDTSSNDLNRICFLTPDVFMCEEFCEFKVNEYYTPPEKNKPVKSKTIVNSVVEDSGAIEELFQTTYDKLIEQKITPNDSYYQWTQELLLPIKYIVRDHHDIGLKWFIAYSKLDKGYKSEEECIKAYNSFNRFKGYSFKYFKMYFERYGINVDTTILQKARNNFQFWIVDEKSKVKLINLEIERLLKKNFFRINNGSEIYYKDGYMCRLATDFSINTEHVYYELIDKYFDDILNDLGVEETDRHSIVRLIKKEYSIQEFKKIVLENKDLESIFKRDTDTEIYLYSKSGLITITKSTVDFTNYTNEDYIDESWLMTGFVKGNEHHIEFDNSLNWKNYKSLSFYEKFSDTEEDLQYLMRILGYMTSTYREANGNFGILFIDGKEIEDNNGGGTGKSIVCENLEYMRKTLTISQPRHSSFIWSGLNYHNIINLEDVNWSDISIMNLRGFYDLNISKEQKGRDSIAYRGKNVPRIIASSNFCPDSTQDSDIRRWHVFTPSRFFNKSNTVEEHLGFKIFDYNPSEWSAWLSFMIECCRMYLAEDLKPIDKWDYVNSKRANELEGDKLFIDLKEYIVEILNPISNVGFDSYFITQNDLTTSVNKLERINSNVKLIIHSIADELGFSVSEKKELSRKTKDYMKKGFLFTKK